MKKVLKWLALAIVCVAAALILVYYLFPGTVINLSIRSARSAADVAAKESPGDGFTWPYLDGGNGDTVVLFHGFGMSRDMWGTLMPALTKKFRVVAPDMPGFGSNSRVKDASYDVKGQALLLDRFLARLGLQRFHLVGFSMGGGVAARYASEFPGKVAKLVLIDAFGVKAAMKNIAEKALDRGERILLYRNAGEYDAVMRLAYAKPPAIPAHFKRYIAALGAQDYDLHGMIFDHLGREGLDTNWKILGKITAPTLVLWGADDRIFDRTCADRYSAGIRNSRKTVIPGSGHMVYMEKPEESVGAVMAFLGGE